MEVKKYEIGSLLKYFLSTTTFGFQEASKEDSQWIGSSADVANNDDHLPSNGSYASIPPTIFKN